MILASNLIEALQLYLASLTDVTENTYIFESRKTKKAITRVQAYKIIKEAATQLKIQGNIGCHSLRKTVGYHSWKNGVQPALLMQLFNHSDYKVTKCYLCIEQEDKDAVFMNLNY